VHIQIHGSSNVGWDLDVSQIKQVFKAFILDSPSKHKFKIYWNACKGRTRMDPGLRWWKLNVKYF